MRHCVRVFCRSRKLPVLEKMLTTLNSAGHGFHLTVGPGSDVVGEENWSYLVLQYKEGRLPLIIQVDHPGREEKLFRSEIEKYTGTIGPAGLSLRKRSVVSHIRTSRYLVTCQIPVPDVDQDGYDAAWYFCQYLVSHAAGLVHADGVGFYSGNKVIIATD